MEVVEESGVALGGLLCFLLGQIDKVRAMWEDVAAVLCVSILYGPTSSARSLPCSIVFVIFTECNELVSMFILQRWILPLSLRLEKHSECVAPE